MPPAGWVSVSRIRVSVSMLTRSALMGFRLQRAARKAKLSTPVGRIRPVWSWVSTRARLRRAALIPFATSPWPQVQTRAFCADFPLSRPHRTRFAPRVERCAHCEHVRRRPWCANCAHRFPVEHGQSAIPMDPRGGTACRLRDAADLMAVAPAAALDPQRAITQYVQDTWAGATRPGPGRGARRAAGAGRVLVARHTGRPGPFRRCAVHRLRSPEHAGAGPTTASGRWPRDTTGRCGLPRTAPGWSGSSKAASPV